MKFRDAIRLFNQPLPLQRFTQDEVVQFINHPVTSTSHYAANPATKWDSMRRCSAIKRLIGFSHNYCCILTCKPESDNTLHSPDVQMWCKSEINSQKMNSHAREIAKRSVLLLEGERDDTHALLPWHTA